MSRPSPLVMGWRTPWECHGRPLLSQGSRRRRHRLVIDFIFFSCRVKLLKEKGQQFGCCLSCPRVTCFGDDEEGDDVSTSGMASYISKRFEYYQPDDPTVGTGSSYPEKTSMNGTGGQRKTKQVTGRRSGTRWLSILSLTSPRRYEDHEYGVPYLARKLARGAHDGDFGCIDAGTHIDKTTTLVHSNPNRTAENSTRRGITGERTRAPAARLPNPPEAPEVYSLEVLLPNNPTNKAMRGACAQAFFLSVRAGNPRPGTKRR